MGADKITAVRANSDIGLSNTAMLFNQDTDGELLYLYGVPT
ncbi:hypothetical protein ACMV5L_16860 [Serratia plymuthica]